MIELIVLNEQHDCVVQCLCVVDVLPRRTLNLSVVSLVNWATQHQELSLNSYV